MAPAFDSRASERNELVLLVHSRVGDDYMTIVPDAGKEVCLLRPTKKDLTEVMSFFGGPTGTRTLDPLLAKQMLYQLSYWPVRAYRTVYRSGS